MAAAAFLALVLGAAPPPAAPPAALASDLNDQAPAPPAEETLYGNYREVPGITEEEIQAIERLKLNRSFLVYGSCPSTEAFMTSDGRAGGFSARMASWLSAMLGIDVQPRIYEWDGLMAAIASGEVDLTGELTPTPDRMREYMMTPPIAERSTRYFRMRGSVPLEETAKKRKLRFGFMAGTVTHEQVAAAGGPPFEAVMTASYQSAYLLLSSGLVDAFIYESPSETAFAGRRDVVSADYFPVLFSGVSLATKNPEAEAVISVVTKAIEAGASRGLMSMYVQGQEDYIRHRYTLLLSPEEFRFLERRIASGDPILYAAESDNYPVSFYNSEEEEFQGIAVDVLAEISRTTGLKFVPANQGPKEWPALLKMLDDGEASLTTELIRTPLREGRYIWSDPPFNRDRYALLSRSSTPDRTPGEILFSTVGLVTDTAWTQAFLSWFPTHPSTRYYPDSGKAFEALERGEIELLMGSKSLNLAMTNYRERPGYKVNYVFESGFDANFGFNIHETMVRSIISKAIPLVDCESISDRWLQRTFDYRGKAARSLVPWLAGCAILLAFMLSFTFSYMRRKTGESMRLERELRDRTLELDSQREEALRSLKAKGDFLARMSHEIRTPMNAVIGMAELALRERIPDEAREMIANILRSGNSLLTIINDILDFSKIESGRMEIVTAPYRLDQLISDAVRIAAVRVAEKPVDFLVEADPRLPAMLSGDEVRIRQVMLNLLSNAAKYTRSGHIRLRVETGTYVSPEGLCAWPRNADDPSLPNVVGPPGELCEWRPKSPDGEFCVWPPVDFPEAPDRGRLRNRLRDLHRDPRDGDGPAGPPSGLPFAASASSASSVSSAFRPRQEAGPRFPWSPWTAGHGSTGATGDVDARGQDGLPAGPARLRPDATHGAGRAAGTGLGEDDLRPAGSAAGTGNRHGAGAAGSAGHGAGAAGSAGHGADAAGSAGHGADAAGSAGHGADAARGAGLGADAARGAGLGADATHGAGLGADASGSAWRAAGTADSVGHGAGRAADAGEDAGPDAEAASGAGSCDTAPPGSPRKVVLRITVSDSGIGIRPEDMEKLFSTFSQFDQHQNRGIEGTGLGLAITRNLAVLMGGTVTVSSEYGKGSVFTAEIPQDVHCPYSPMAHVKDPQSARALFLEPDPVRSESLEWTMARLGASWETAADPSSFRNLLRDGSFAYVFAREEDEMLTAGLLEDAGCLAKTVYLTPVGAKPARIPGSLSSPMPLWSLAISRILNDETDRLPARERSDASLTAPTARALVVDDLPVNLKVARGLLGPFKVAVDTCESGADAVRLCAENPYDIVFMDHVMPGMDGIEATERIRQGPGGRHVPIIALTANAVSGMREMFMSHGMNGFISKPIEVAKLETALRDWLPSSKIVEKPAPDASRDRRGERDVTFEPAGKPAGPAQSGSSRESGAGDGSGNGKAGASGTGDGSGNGKAGASGAPRGAGGTGPAVAGDGNWAGRAGSSGAPGWAGTPGTSGPGDGDGTARPAYPGAPAGAGTPGTSGAGDGDGTARPAYPGAPAGAGTPGTSGPGDGDGAARAAYPGAPKGAGMPGTSGAGDGDGAARAGTSGAAGGAGTSGAAGAGDGDGAASEGSSGPAGGAVTSGAAGAVAARAGSSAAAGDAGTSGAAGARYGDGASRAGSPGPSGAPGATDSGGNGPAPAAEGSSSRSPRTPPAFRDGGFDPEASLAQLAGDHELMAEVLEMYIQSTPALLDIVRDIDPGDVVRYSKTFHSLKGSSLNVGARKVGEMAATLEKAAKEGDGDAVTRGNQAFIETVEGLIVQMRNYLTQTASSH